MAYPCAKTVLNLSIYGYLFIFCVVVAIYHYMITDGFSRNINKIKIEKYTSLISPPSRSNILPNEANEQPHLCKSVKSESSVFHQ